MEDGSSFLLPEDLYEEKERLTELILNSEEELTGKEFIEKYASQKFKDWLKARDELKKKLWEEEGAIYG
jgi:hypothetical protein